MRTRIHAATADDLESWMRMRHALWPDCPPEKHRIEIEQLWSSDGVVLLAEAENGQLTGFVEISIRKDHVEGVTTSQVPYLEGWYVTPDARSQGVGRALLDAAEEWARQAGFTELASDAEVSNTGSIAAHARLGFREVGRTVHFVKRLRAGERGRE